MGPGHKARHDALYPLLLRAGVAAEPGIEAGGRIRSINLT